MTSKDGWHIGSAGIGSNSSPRRPIRTSITHPLQIATVPVGENGGRIGVTLCPGKKGPSVFGAPWDRDLAADITVICEWGASSVLTLIEPFEFDLLQVRRLPTAVRDAGLVWLHAPIKDVSIPDARFDAAWKTIGPRLINDLRNGRSVVIHCRGGRGRAGLVAAKLLAAMGYDGQEAIDSIRRYRPGAIETKEQESYILAT